MVHQNVFYILTCRNILEIDTAKTHATSLSHYRLATLTFPKFAFFSTNTCPRCLPVYITS